MLVCCVMKPHVRAAAAATAFAHGLRRDVLSVYEHETRGYSRTSVSVRGNDANGFDYDHNCRISGSLPSMQHHGTGARLQLAPKRLGAYIGFDHDTASYFTVKVSCDRICLFDCRERTHFTFTVWS